MQAGQITLLNLLGDPQQQFEIPLYQRRYAWTNGQRGQFWLDILRVAERPKSARHFTGSVVYAAGPKQIGQVQGYRLIDGQQRVTTTTLLLVALAEYLDKHPDAAQKVGMTGAEIRRVYLLNERFDGDQRYKLSLSYADKPTMQALLSGQALPKEAAAELERGLQFFRDRLNEPGLDVAQVWRGLSKLEVVQITLTEGVDDLGLIFESLNSTGKALAQADLIRNNVLMGLDQEDQKKLGEGKWREIEGLFARTEEGTFDRFMRDFLTMRTRNLPNEDEVYAAFKDYRAGRPKDETVDVLVRDISDMAELYLKVVQPEEEQDAAVQQALKDLQALRIRVIQPFVLELLQDREKGLLKDETLEKALRAIESFLMRRSVTGERTSPLNKFFATLGRDLPKQENYLLELERALLRFQDRDRDGFPDDDAFRLALENEPLYTRLVCKPLLVRIERARNTQEKVEGVLTIEHVMPQKPGETWQAALGAPENKQWKEDHARLVHRLGNLTLTGYNSELGNRSFADKKTMPPKSDDEYAPRGYKYSRLLLTNEIADDKKYPLWNQQVIAQRGAALAEEALKLFPYPKHLANELEKLREEGRQRSRTPTLEAHLDTSNQALRALYMQLRSRLMALSPEVTEEPKKHYIAYKAGSNFCDMVPQPALNTVKCWLNIPLDKLDDPSGLVEDIGDRGRAGNGNLEVVIGLHSNLSAFEHLAKQAMEYQLARRNQASTSAQTDADLSKLAPSTLALWQEVAERCESLGLESIDHGYYRAYRGNGTLLEVYPRRNWLRIWVKAQLEDVPADQQASWQPGGKFKAWIVRNTATGDELEQVWQVIEQAFEAQESVITADSNNPSDLQRQEIKALQEDFLHRLSAEYPNVTAQGAGRSTVLLVGNKEFARIRKNETDGFVYFKSPYADDFSMQQVGDLEMGLERFKQAYTTFKEKGDDQP